MTPVRFYVSTRVRQGGDPGEIEYGYYTLDGRTLALTNSEGVPHPGGAYRRVLVADEDAGTMARVMLREWLAFHGPEKSFSRPLRLPPLSIV